MDFDLQVTKPDYGGGSIVNLMMTIKAHFGVIDTSYPMLKDLPPNALAGKDRVILLVVDGLGADLLNEFAARRESESLRDFQRARVTSVYPPTTASAVTTFMSGQAPQQHGLTGWFMNFREIGATTAVLPFISRFGRAGLSEQGVDINRLVTCQHMADELPISSAMLLPQEIANSDFSRCVGGRAKRVGYRGLGEFAGEISSFINAPGNAAYLYAYWSELDHLSHIHGPSSERVYEHFLELEAALLPLMSAASATNCAVIVTADHGFLDSGPDECMVLEEHPQLADMLAMPLFGEPRSAYCILRKGCDDEFEDYVRQELDDYLRAVPSAQLIEDDWFGLGTPHRELAARVGDYTLQMKERYTIRDRLVSEQAFDLFGMHGGITAAEQWVPLLLSF